LISLSARLNRGLTAILLVLFLFHWMAADYVIKTVAENQMLTRLEHDGDSLLAFLDVAADGSLHFNADHLGLVYEQPYSGHYFIIQADAQVFQSHSMGAETLSTQPVAIGKQQRYHSNGPQSQPVLALTRSISRQGQTFNLTVAEDLTALYDEIELLRLGYMGLTVLVLLTAILLQTIGVRRAIRPLLAIRADVQCVARGQSSRIAAHAPSEIQPLVDEINRLLALVDRRLHQSRHAIGNLAHALKTPLSILFHIASDPFIAEKPALRRQLEAQTAAIHQRIESELKRARLSGAIQPGTGFNPKMELMALVRLLSIQYTEKNLRIDLAAPEEFTPYDREDMLELTGNLADNACKWARERVVIKVECLQDRFILTVADDGPGCSEPELADLTRRGYRLDETQPGHGLGLSIVRDIVGFYNGSLVFDRSPVLGGLRVTVGF